MSCNCNHINSKHGFSCPCDSFLHPEKLNIGMGLTDLPRQMAGFPEFRRAMLFSLRPKPFPLRPKNDPDDNKVSLDAWKANQEDDLGLMLLEMWAYICDSLSFYDKVLAQEEYIRTAIRRPSLRRLVALTGYLPAPAVGSFVYLTAIAEGRSKIMLPEKTAFRSSGFNGNPPQVFETEDNFFIHPFTSKWNVKPPQPNFIEQENPSQLLMIPQLEIKAPAPLLLADQFNHVHTQGLWVIASDAYTGADENKYTRLKFSNAAALPAKYLLEYLQLQKPMQSAGLWTMNVYGTGLSISEDGKKIVMDGLYRNIKSGQFVLISKNAECRWFAVTEVREVTRQQSESGEIKVNNVTYPVPGISVTVTQLELDVSINAARRKNAGSADWHDGDKPRLTVHFMLQAAGVIVNEQKTILSSGDQVFFKEKTERPNDNYDPSDFFLTDKNATAVKLNGRIDYSNSSLGVSMNQERSPMLLPVQAFGNLIRASRGETVLNEILGSGNAALINQTFKLKKKPLTYFPAPTVANDRGLKNTLRVYVDGIRWTEVSSFFNRSETEEIYIVRQNDEGDSYVTFGDGLRGRRLTTGTGNIVASYRFGAEKAVPPAGSITQISKPVKDFSAINNPMPASGGADAETAAALKSAAPKSILTLGRIVSIQDAEAVALTVPGVRAVQIEWRWHHEKQCPVIHLWYIGGKGIEETLRQRIKSMCDPTVVIYAEQAQAVTANLTTGILVSERFITEEVIREVKKLFIGTPEGILIPELQGVGRPLFRSKIFAAALSVPGVVAVKNILFNYEAFSQFAQTPGAGKYFDFESGSFNVTINE